MPWSHNLLLLSKGFNDEYRKWRDENKDVYVHLKRDFLQEVKGYCLIHNPYGYGGYMGTNMRDLTKKQKEFLYGYFIDMGDRFRRTDLAPGPFPIIMSIA